MGSDCETKRLCHICSWIRSWLFFCPDLVKCVYQEDTVPSCFFGASNLILTRICSSLVTAGSWPINNLVCSSVAERHELQEVVPTSSNRVLSSGNCRWRPLLLDFSSVLGSFKEIEEFSMPVAILVWHELSLCPL